VNAAGCRLALSRCGRRRFEMNRRNQVVPSAKQDRRTGVKHFDRSFQVI
jgi:hypothetical protein